MENAKSSESASEISLEWS